MSIDWPLTVSSTGILTLKYRLFILISVPSSASASEALIKPFKGSRYFEAEVCLPAPLSQVYGMYRIEYATLTFPSASLDERLRQELIFDLEVKFLLFFSTSLPGFLPHLAFLPTSSLVPSGFLASESTHDGVRWSLLIGL